VENVRHVISRRSSLASIGAFVLASRAALAAESPPPVIRFAAVSAGYGKPFGQQVMGIVQAGGYVEAELKPAGVRATFDYPAGAGPAINEAIGNGEVDFAAYGDLPTVIGRAGGLATRVVASRGAEILYVGVRTGVKAQTIAEIKGLRVALQRGTINHQLLDRLLAENGLSERDVTLYDLNTADQLIAMANGNVDVVFGTGSLLNQQDQGIVRIIYTTRGKITPDGFGAFTVTDDFAQRYPLTTRAVVRAWVKAAHWGSLDANRAAVLDIWARAGTPRTTLEQNFTGVSLKRQNDPLLDGFYLAQLRNDAAFALDNKLIRRQVDVDGWVDRSFIDGAIHDLTLQEYWAPRALPAPATTR
jgi:sulfonate transport system substrate-binding protein